MQKQYSPIEWICIDIANQFGLDKKTFEERIQWVKENYNRLTVLSSPKKERPLYVKAVMGLLRAAKGQAIGHIVGLDATCSGMSIMSVLTKCYKGCYATNLIDPDVRNDAYTMVTNRASEYLGGGFAIDRGDAKNATMTALYGSVATPRDIFGEDTPELEAFYKGLSDIAPGAVELLGDLRAAWQPFALEHKWVLPDNFHARIKVMQKIEGARVEVDELGHSTFSMDYYVNEGTKKDLKLVANVTHSFDAYLLRSLQRRCSFNVSEVRDAAYKLRVERSRREAGGKEEELHEITETMHVYLERYTSSRVADVVILPYLTFTNVRYMEDAHIRRLIVIIDEMLEGGSFDVITVHDEFKCHPNHCNAMRRHYVSILADLARGRALEDVFKQITGVEPTYAGAMNGNELADMIMESNYAIS